MPFFLPINYLKQVFHVIKMAMYRHQIPNHNLDTSALWMIGRLTAIVLSLNLQIFFIGAIKCPHLRLMIYWTSGLHKLSNMATNLHSQTTKISPALWIQLHLPTFPGKASLLISKVKDQMVWFHRGWIA